MATLWQHNFPIKRRRHTAINMTDNDTHLRLRGKDGDIFFYHRRCPKKLKPVLKKEWITYSLNTSDIKEARKQRDKISKELDDLLERTNEGMFRHFLDEISGLSREEREGREFFLWEELQDKYPHLGHPEGKDLPTPTEIEEAEAEAMLVAKGGEVPEKYRLTLLETKRMNAEYHKLPYKTKNSHDMAVKLFLRYLGKPNIPIDHIRRRDVKHFIKWLEDENGDAKGTIQKRIHHLSSLFQYAQDEEPHLEDKANPFQKHGIKTKNHVQHYLPWDIDELRKVIPFLKNDTDKLAVYIAWYTGARQDEIFTLREQDVYKDKETGVFVMAVKPWDMEQGKNIDSRRLIPVHKELKPLLKDFKGFRIDASTYSKRFTRAKKKVVGDNPRMVYHSIRHNVADTWLRNNIPEAISSRIAGHSRKGETMTYGYYAGDLDLKQGEKVVNLIPKL